MQVKGGCSSVPAAGPSPVASVPRWPSLRDRVLKSSLGLGSEHVEAILEEALDEGISHPDLLSGVLAPVAARMGEMWSDDEITFLDVTIGTGRLHRCLHQLRRLPRPEPETVSNARVLVTTLPGEQHTFGAAIFCHLLWLDGVDAALVIPPSGGTVDLDGSGYDVVGVSVPCTHSVRALGQAVARLGRPGRFPVVLGGPCASPELASSVGADGCADTVASFGQWLGRPSP